MPENPQVQALLDEGWDCLDDGEYGRALAIGKKLEKLRHASAFEIMALAFVRKGNLARAISVLERGVVLAPDAWRLWLLLGDQYIDSSRWDDARKAFLQALSSPEAESSSVYLEMAALSNRLGDPDAALKELDLVTGEDQALPAAALRVKVLTTAGRAAEASAYAGRVLNAYAPADDDDADDDEDEDLAEIMAAWSEAEWALGHKDRALELAWGAISWDKNNELAMWLLREVEGRPSRQGKEFRILLEGVCPEPIDDDSAPSGFFIAYTVIADSPEAAFAMASRFEPDDVRQSLRLEDYQLLQPNTEDPTGVYWNSGYSYFTREP